MRFTASLWLEIGDIVHQLVRHPFIRELSEGSLHKTRFDHYVQQDCLYLVDYTRAVSLIAAKSRNTERILQFLQIAEYSIEVELKRHRDYMASHAIPPAERKSPSCFAYTNFLLSVAALENIEVAMAAILPCFSVYEKVAEYIYANATESNPYRDWIDVYAGEEFKQATEEALEITDELAARTGETAREKMKEVFVLATKMEYLFWDSAYRKEQWII